MLAGLRTALFVNICMYARGQFHIKSYDSYNSPEAACISSKWELVSSWLLPRVYYKEEEKKVVVEQ